MNRSRKGIRRLLTGAFGVVLLCGAPFTQGQIVPLVDKNSSAQINAGTSSGMFNWTVDGVNQLVQQWFWFRVGAVGGESPINALGPASILTPNARTAYITYANAAVSVEVDYLLTGFAVGSRNSDISETIRISNRTAAPLDFHFFQYSDFDLAGTPGSDTVQLGQDIYGKYNEAAVTKVGSSVSETVVSPGANHGEAAIFNSTLVKLNDANPTTLNDNVGPVGPGDATWAFEWDFTIAPGASLGISKDKYLHWNPVPEPSTVALLVGGLIAARLYRRRSLV